jgi:hypothetical protein
MPFHFSIKPISPRTIKLEYKGMNLVAPIKELRNSTLDELKRIMSIQFL